MNSEPTAVRHEFSAKEPIAQAIERSWHRPSGRFSRSPNTGQKPGATGYELDRKSTHFYILHSQFYIPAFSLIELLAVIAILGLLIAVLMPSLGGARRSASSSACQSNLRQWAAATIMYAQNCDGWLPRRGQGAQTTTLINRGDDWFNALPPLMGRPSYMELFEQGRVERPGARSVWMCPAAVENDGLNYFAYGMNMRLSIWLTATPDKIDRVAPASVQVLFADAPGKHCSVFPSPQPFSPDPRHDARLNIAFLDGHVAAFQGDYAGCGVGDLMRPDLRWDVPNSPWPGPNP